MSILACSLPAILGAVGFSASGPVLGSVAAGWQASIGSVATGSLFAFVQSAGMGGGARGIIVTSGAAAGGIVAVAAAATGWTAVTETVDRWANGVRNFFRKT